MSRRVPLHSGLVAVGLSLALHGLLGLALWLQPQPKPTVIPSPPSPPGTQEIAEIEEPGECRMYLIPEPRKKAPREEPLSSPAAPRMVLAPPPVSTLPAAPLAPNVIPSPPIPSAAPPTMLGSGNHVQGHPGSGDPGIPLFGIPPQAQKIVYVLDRSGSMGKDSLLLRASRELLNSLEKLPATAQFQVLVYNSTVEPLPRPLFQWRSASADNRQQLALALQTLAAEGGTDHLPALRRAIGLRPDVIFFVTDADDLTEEQVRLATEWNAGKSMICSIELNLANRQREFMPLQRLARANGGRYQAVDLEKQEPLNPQVPIYRFASSANR